MIRVSTTASTARKSRREPCSAILHVRRNGSTAPRLVVAVIASIALLAGADVARAQQVTKLPHIGVLRLGPLPPEALEAFQQGLRGHGYIQGQDIVVEYRVAERVTELPDLAAGLVRQKVDVLLASGTAAVLPARNATRTIPVVFVAAIDPVVSGVVPSLARPGGNVTGVSAAQAALTGKRMELMKELLPKLSRIALLVRDPSPDTATYVKEAEGAARALGTQLQVLTVRDPGDFEGAFSAARGAGALVQASDALFTAHRAQLAALALKNRLPTIAGLGEMVQAGALMSYGANLGDIHRLAATQVHKILKGAKPADLPIEQPTKFELIVNLKTAKALGLTIPPAVLTRADAIIE